MKAKRKSAAGSASRSKHLLGELSGVLKLASGTCSHYGRHFSPRPHVITLTFAEMHDADSCYLLLNDVRALSPNIPISVRQPK